ncbi:MAG: hypothetical protein PVI99_01275 [Anaerolineales bacterium]|jgi:hypothetical protein
MRYTNHPWVHRSEQGQASLEFIVVLTFFMFLISWMFLSAPMFHIAIAVRQAAYDCAFSAVQSLSHEQGYMQGQIAGRQSFDAFGLDSNRAAVALLGNWDREGLVTCRVAYRVPLENFPLRQVAPVPAVLEYSYSLPIQKYKSIWQ